MTKTMRATPAAAGHGPRMSDQPGGSINSEHTHNPGQDQELRFHGAYTAVRSSPLLSAYEGKTRATTLAEALLRDRAERTARPRAASRPKVEGSDFDPFAVTRWRGIAGGNPGYLVKTPMRRGPVGWFIACGHCGAEFESKGWKYCPTCMVLPAEERRSAPAVTDRQCQAPGCVRLLSRRRRADAKYCDDKCAKAAENARSYQGSRHLRFRGDRGDFLQQNQGPKNVLIGPTDFPINVIGGNRFPQAKPVPKSGARHRRRPEDAIQRAVVQHLRARAVPNVFAFHPANGGYRKPIEAAILKGLGVVAGVGAFCGGVRHEHPDRRLHQRNHPMLRRTTGVDHPAPRRNGNGLRQHP